MSAKQPTTIRLDPTILSDLQQEADKYTEGNLSKLMEIRLMGKKLMAFQENIQKNRVKIVLELKKDKHIADMMIGIAEVMKVIQSSDVYNVVEIVSSLDGTMKSDEASS